MGWNVPDDWGSYYNHCSRCGGRYHASEGSCGCLDDLDCQCGSCDWVGDADDIECRQCGGGPYQKGPTYRTTHVARKHHGPDIRPGDTYRRMVSLGHYRNGPRTLKVRKWRIEKGLAWAEPVPRTRYERMLADD